MQYFNAGYHEIAATGNYFPSDSNGTKIKHLNAVSRRAMKESELKNSNSNNSRIFPNAIVING